VTLRTELNAPLAKSGGAQERSILLQIVPAQGDQDSTAKGSTVMTRTEYLHDQAERAERLATPSAARLGKV
jgi:hypothetical protein